MHGEAEFSVELDILQSVGFKIAFRVLLLEMVDVAIHQCRSNAKPLGLGGHADGTEMDMGSFRIEMAPSSKPSDDPRDGFTERP